MPKSFLLKRRSLNSANAQNEAKPPPLEKVIAKKPFDRVEKEMDYRNFYEEAKTSLLPEPPYSSVYSVSPLDLNEEILKCTAQRPVNTLIPFCGIITSDSMNNYMASDNETTQADYSSFQGERSLSENLEWSKSISQPIPLDAALEDGITFPPPSKIIPGRVSTAPARHPFQCHQCGKVFKTKYTLAIHLKMPSHTIARPFVCNVCGKGFRLSSTLCRHKIIHTSEKPHKCQICQKAFNRSSTLKTHIRTHSVEKEFICDRCGKGFHQKGNLRNHILIHTGEKPYKCTLCRKAFNKLSNLKFHMHVHTDNSPYRCRVCKVSFSRRCDLKTHTENTHSVQTGSTKTET